MSQECARCVVKLALKELHWEEFPGSPLHLTGPPIFLRVCVLGQLQHTPLLQPMFPLNLQDILTFDRVFTNCTEPSLLKEIITGEHVDIVMVQVTEDYEGGNILARYEAPAELFLFPEPPSKPGKLRTAAMSKSRKYRHCPHLKFTTSTTLTKVTIHPPFNTSSSHIGGPEQISSSKPTAKNDPKPLALSQQKEGVAPQDKLHLLLSCYMEPHPQQNQETVKGKHRDEPNRLNPLIPKLASTKRKNDGGPKSLRGGPNKNTTRVRRSRTSPPTDLYHCCTAFLGPHNWTACPRRSFRKHGHHRSKSTSPLTPRCSTLHRHVPNYFPTLGPSSEKHNLVPRQVRFEPFSAGRADPQALSRRDFCGQSPGRAERHSSREERVRGREERRQFLGKVSGEERCLGRKMENQLIGNWTQTRPIFPQSETRPIFPQSETHPISPQSKREAGVGVGHREPTLSQLYQRYVKRSSGLVSSLSHATEGEPSATVDGSITPSEESEKSSVESLSSCEERPRIKEDMSSYTSSPPLSPSHLTQTSLLVSTRRQRHDLVSKYLQYGNGRMGMSTPAKLIENKLNILIQECCECRHSAESLGQDDMTEDNERLRASLSAEREDQLNRSAKLLPDQSVLIGVGGANGEAYWSQRVAEFQGKHHRLVFHETMEKIYHRLYQNSINIH